MTYQRQDETATKGSDNLWNTDGTVEKSKVGDKLTLTVVRFDNNYKMTKFDVEVNLIEDRGTVSQQVEEPTTQDNSYYYFDPLDFFGNGN